MYQLLNVFQIFQRAAVNHFGQYQPSGFCSAKFHVVRHFGDEMRQYGSMRILDAGIYENLHDVLQEE